MTSSNNYNIPSLKQNSKRNYLSSFPFCVYTCFKRRDLIINHVAATALRYPKKNYPFRKAKQTIQQTMYVHQTNIIYPKHNVS